jgi:RHS repeat-associated protein
VKHQTESPDSPGGVTYTDDGQVATRTVGTVTTTYTYTALDQVKTITTSSGGGTLTYGYDPAGNLTTLTDTRGTTTYTYDAANHLTAMSDAFGHLTQIGLDANARRTDTWFATNTANTTWTAHTHDDFDTSGRLARTKTTRDSSDTTTADIVTDLTYSYTAPGPATCAGSPAAGTDTTTRWSLTDATNPTTPVTTRYCYDKSNRLTDANPLNGHHYAYGYDANGNTTTSTTDGTTTSYPANPANQVTATGYTYDGAGNLTAAPAQTFTYNGAGQTTSNNGSSADFASADQVERTHTYDGLDMIYGRAPTSGPTAGQAWLQSWTTTAGPAYLDRDPDGVPISLTFTGNTYYYVRDGLGSVTNLVSAQDQSVVATYTYTPYGGLISGGDAGMGYTNRIRYAGGEYDRRTGYTHFGERFYDPTTTKFTQQDPITKLANPQNGNTYQYAAANPCNNTDPTGRSPGEDLGKIAGSALACVGGGSVVGGLFAAYGVIGGPEAAVLTGVVGFIYGCGFSIISDNTIGFTLPTD